MILAIANQKGGVGKTTTAVTFAHGAALRFRRVLLVDLDPQGNCADQLGVEAGQDLYNWLAEGRGTMIQARPGLDLVRSERASTVELKARLNASGQGILTLADYLDGHQYDLVVLDCAPSVDVLLRAALVAADHLIIPALMDQLAIKGITEMYETIGDLKRRTHCRISGILPTRYDRTTNETQRQLASLLDSPLKGLVYPPVPQDVTVREANRAGRSLWEYAPMCRAVQLGYEPALGRLLELAV